MPTSLANVARAVGVSNATASRVLANSAYPVTEETRQKVLKAAEELDYRPNLIARGLRTEQTACVGLIVENILSPFIPPSHGASTITCASTTIPASSSTRIGTPWRKRKRWPTWPIGT